MAKRKQTLSRKRRGPTPVWGGLLAATLVVALLYFAKAVIEPLALAVLLTFILTPLVIAVQRRGVHRVPAALGVVFCSLLVFGVVGWGVGSEVANLAGELPAHQEEIRAKIMRLQNTGSGPFSRMLHSLGQTAGESAHVNAAAAAAKAPTVTPGGPVAPIVVTQPPVVVEQSDSSAISRLLVVASALLEPIATGALVLILVVFMLIKREDMRNRVIGLLGHGRLTGTTRVLVESSDRLSRFLLMQLCVNISFGVLFGTGLLILGVPFSFLWGVLAVLLRFVPYIGSWIAASLPILLSFAISPGFKEPLMVLGMFGVLDLFTANVAEPLLFGHSTGVSPVALLIAAVFWTWIWGPVGLVLSTPLTVCLVVLGQHVPRLRFLSLLLGDQPGLEPHLAYYQRLLAGDRLEATSIAREYQTAHGADRLPDDVLMPALRLARRDRTHAGLAAADETFIFDSTRAILDEWERRPLDDAQRLDQAVVLGCPAHHVAEEIGLHILARSLDGVPCRMEVESTRPLHSEIVSRVLREKPAVLFIGILPPGGIVQARFLCRRLRRHFPDLPMVIGYWGRVRDFDRLLSRLRSAGATYVTTSISQARAQIASLLAPHSTEGRDALPSGGSLAAAAV